MPEQNDFYTIETLRTFSGCVGATMLIVSVLRATKQSWATSPILGIIVALISTLMPSCILPALEGESVTPTTWFVALINGCLVYAASAGIVAGAEHIVPGGGNQGGDEGGAAPGRRWRWY